MNNERSLRAHLIQLKDAVEMQMIREAVAEGRTAEEACSEVVGGSFNLSPEVEQYVRN